MSTPAARSPRRRRLPVDDRRQELIDAALRLFSERGAEDVSVEDIAETAGASRALLYHYFGSKQELYVAAMRRAADELLARLTEPRTGAPAERFMGGLRAYLDYVEAHGPGFAALLRGGPAARAGEVGAIVEEVRTTILANQLAGLGMPAAPPLLRVALRSWIGSVEAACVEWIERGDLDRPDLERLLARTFAAALAAAGHPV